MRRNLIASVATLGALIVSGCASPLAQGPAVTGADVRAERNRQLHFAVESYAQEALRLRAITWRISRAGLDFCPTIHADWGLKWWRRSDFPSSLRRSAATVFGVDKGLKIAWVAPNGPAHAADVREGDRVIAINGRKPETRRRRLAQQIARARDSGRLDLTLQRGGATLERAIAPVTVCAYDLVYENTYDFNAYADGETLYVTRALVDRMPSDDALAFVIGHELAHNALGHLRSSSVNHTLGALAGATLDVAVFAMGLPTGGYFKRVGQRLGWNLYSQGFEREADYLGAYLAARAGYAPGKATGAMEAISLENPASAVFARTHPTTSERAVRLKAIAEEIARKTAQGRPLIPDGLGPKRLRPHPEIDTVPARAVSPDAGSPDAGAPNA
ncbi:MAG: M48 family metalloprotease [Maricaulaceae bacterium]